MYHILICDDEQDIVNALKIYLMNPDFKLFEANTGVQALEVMEREDIHLILLDIMMPEMDGISAMVKIREKSNVPIILLTAKSEDTVAVHIRHLREKIEINPADPRYLKVVWGQGYKMEKGAKR